MLAPRHDQSLDLAGDPRNRSFEVRNPAHCQDLAPAGELPGLEFSEADFPDTLATPEALLLHARELWQRARERRVPSCRFPAAPDRSTP